MFTLALVCFIIEFKHLLTTIISLEFLALTVFLLISLPPSCFYYETLYSMLYIPIAACEAALGLTIIVIYTSKKGNEIFKTH